MSPATAAASMVLETLDACSESASSSKRVALAIRSRRSRPKRSVVVPHVLRINLWGYTNMDDSLSRYASTSGLVSTLSTLHLTKSNILSHVLFGTRRSPIRPPSRVPRSTIARWHSGSDSTFGANHSSSSFSGPSNGPPSSLISTRVASVSSHCFSAASALARASASMLAIDKRESHSIAATRRKKTDEPRKNGETNPLSASPPPASS